MWKVYDNDAEDNDDDADGQIVIRKAHVSLGPSELKITLNISKFLPLQKL